MDITPKPEKNSLRIERYGTGGIVVNGACYLDTLLLCDKALQTMPEITAKNLEDEKAYVCFIVSSACEILLIGTGQHTRFISPAFKRKMKEIYQITIDVMDTGSACRTYNILSAEARPVAALLLQLA